MTTRCDLLALDVAGHCDQPDKPWTRHKQCYFFMGKIVPFFVAEKMFVIFVLKGVKHPA